MKKVSRDLRERRRNVPLISLGSVAVAVKEPASDVFLEVSPSPRLKGFLNMFVTNPLAPAPPVDSSVNIQESGLIHSNTLLLHLCGSQF